MNFLKTLRVSTKALKNNKMRSFLTALGIIIGVAAVITMISIGEGAKKSVEERFESMGTNMLFVRAGSRSVRGRSSGGGTYQNLTSKDAQAILEKCDAVAYVSPSVSARAQVVYGGKNWNTSIQGGSETYTKIRNWELSEGKVFTQRAVKSSQKVCVLGPEVVKNLFRGNDNPVGKVVRIKKIPFKVIGVLKSKGQSGGWFNQDDMILAPYTTVQKRLLGQSHVSSIDLSAVDSTSTAKAQKQIEVLLRKRHKISPGQEDDFNVRNMLEIAEGAAESTEILTYLLGGIAVVALIVGGIGIMNIMLVSVTERIREIGLRMAVGAKGKFILLQFLTEAIMLCLAGGIAGIALGLLGSKLISYIAGWKTIVSFGSIILAFMFSAIVGITFGFYPAYKASRMDPIEALRYE